MTENKNVVFAEEKWEEFKKRNLKILRTSTIVTAGIAGVGGCYIGYKCGVDVTMKRISKGIAKIWETDPTLREHMWKAVIETSIKEATK